ncbi:DUF2087 domain-containing protein [Phenylobacterium sp.]|uniref:DUF2087 domain-containing protein n=1 Tax=Phenylobacterium sp. TaxID=1871053 RepID=UPI00272F692B|nr:DUF2087 domain-containing protein [Phenylobacterium sp.]MDP1987455.1 DUF2087 domain-containing protein [Phenylobacterium sp.]
MPRTAIPYTTPDISALAKTLRDQLARQGPAPGHVEMLNILARAAGAKNFQHYRARSEPLEAPPAPAADLARVEKVARQFDPQGRLLQWPAKPSHQALALWGLWAALPAGDAVSEAVFNGRLNALHAFGDPAILRRSMVSAGLVSRTSDCRDYRRIEQRPPADAQALIRRLRGRTAP